MSCDQKYVNASNSIPQCASSCSTCTYKIVAQPNNSFSIKNTSNSKYLISDGSSSHPVFDSECDDGDANYTSAKCLWNVEPVDDGKFAISNIATNQYITISGSAVSFVATSTPWTLVE